MRGKMSSLPSGLRMGLKMVLTVLSWVWVRQFSSSLFSQVIESKVGMQRVGSSMIPSATPSRASSHWSRLAWWTSSH